MPRRTIRYSLGAKEYAFLLLKYRMRSEKELYSRLKAKGFDEQEAKKVVAFLKEKNFIDDRSFTRSWIASRLSRPLGVRRIRLELFQKGKPESLVNGELARLKSGYCEEKVVEELAQERLGRLLKSDPIKARNRTFAFLIRRGFSPEVVTDILNKLCRQIF